MVIIRNAYRPGDFSFLAKQERNLHLDVVAFIARHGMAATRFGKLATKDAQIVARIARGDNLRPSTVERIYSFIEQYEGGE